VNHGWRSRGWLAVLVLALACAGCTRPAAPAGSGAPRSQPEASAPTAPAAAGGSTAAAPAASAADAQAVESFYRGKTVRILVGYGAGGPYDTFSRIVARYLPQYIPGHPTVVVENRPGAASLLAANLVYNSEPKDGTAMVSASSGLPMLQLLGKEGVSFDSARFQWLGGGNKTLSTCAARTDSGVNSIQDVIGPNGKQLVVGAIGPGTGTYDTPTTMNAVLGTNFKIVSGYDSTAKVILAVEAQEATGMCANLDTMTSTVRQLFEGDTPTLKMIAMMGHEPSDHPWLRGVPPAETLAQTDEARLILSALHSAALANLPYAVAPEVPRDRVAALRQALAQTFADPQFRADAEKAGFEVNPSTGEELAQIYATLFTMPPATVAKLKDVLK
jgi:tripartite-type tricarboxylate transporter receptor subunit TctC